MKNSGLKKNHRSFWNSEAQKLVYLVNGLWLVQRFLPIFIAFQVLFTLAVILTRHWQLNLDYLLTVYALVHLGALSVCLYWVTRYPFHKGDALLRLETFLQLDNKLTTAAEGKTQWPPQQTIPQLPFGFRWDRLHTSACCAGLLFLASWIIPVGRPAEKALAAAETPPVAWTQIEEWIETLEEETLIDEQSLEALQEKVDELESQNPQEWYSQDSLEAGENLREQTAQSLESLARNLQAASSLLQTYSEAPTSLNSPQIETLQKQFAEALNNLELNGLPLDEGLMKALQNVDMQSMAGVDPQQLQEMMKKLQSGASACSRCVSIDPEALQKMTGLEKIPAPGTGDITRGPGAAPLTLTEDGTELDPQKTDTVSNTDFSNTALGEVVKVTQSAGNEDETEFQGLQQGGAAQNTGQGGQAIWKDELTPEDKQILQRYFK